MYKDKMEIIAMSPSYYDSDSSVAAYQASMGLSFPMAVCQDNWPSAFGITGYPTSIVIDRYGVICLIEVGGVTSLKPFASVFEHFTADDYKQRLCENGMADLITAMKPTETMPSSEDISAAINSGDIQVTYRAEEGEAADTTWPFVITERDGVKCLKASNSGVENSYAIIYADVTLKAGQAIGFDYIISSEQAVDALVVIVDGEDIYQMSGHDETAKWKSAYPWVALADGTYELALCYLKDETEDVGEDTVYIKNMRVVDASAIDVATHIPRQAATTEDGFEYTYAQVVLNEKDGYYHVGTPDGPLLLANMMNYSEFNEEETLWDIVYNGKADADHGRISNKHNEVAPGHDLIHGRCRHEHKAHLTELRRLQAERADHQPVLRTIIFRTKEKGDKQKDDAGENRRIPHLFCPLQVPQAPAYDEKNTDTQHHCRQLLYSFTGHDSTNSGHAQGA